jgi:hypothetical protein
MIPLFDVFRTDDNGHLLWCATAATLAEARAKVRALAQGALRAYVILSQRTGDRIIVQPNSDDDVLVR